MTKHHQCECRRTKRGSTSILPGNHCRKLAATDLLRWFAGSPHFHILQTALRQQVLEATRNIIPGTIHCDFKRSVRVTGSRLCEQFCMASNIINGGYELRESADLVETSRRQSAPLRRIFSFCPQITFLQRLHSFPVRCQQFRALLSRHIMRRKTASENIIHA